ncbi:MAG: hypothetical protein ACRCZE_00770 [Candidatus Altimarinota bacterium]
MFLKQYKDLSPFGKMAVSSFRGAILGMLVGLLLGIVIYFLQYLLQGIDSLLNPEYSIMMFGGSSMWPSVTIPGGLGSAFGTLVGAIMGGISGIKSSGK